MLKNIHCVSWGALFIMVFSLLIGCTQPEEPAPTPTPGFDVQNGAVMYGLNCAPCHGRSGQGIPNLGKDLTNTPFMQRSNDEELVDFIITGRTIIDPANTTGIAMPPKGDNSALSISQIRDIVAYLRSLS